MRSRRICSEIKDWFLRRGYPQRIVEEQMGRAFRLPLKHDTQQNKIESGIPLAVTYNPAFNNLSTTLRENFNIFYSDLEFRTVFTPSPLIAYRSPQNLKSFLVRSKTYPLQRTVTSSKCGSKRYQFCLNVSETDIFESFQTKKAI